jgi:hypothetical protein
MSEIILFEQTVSEPTVFEIEGQEITIFGTVKIASKEDPATSPFDKAEQSTPIVTADE